MITILVRDPDIFFVGREEVFIPAVEANLHLLPELDFVSQQASSFALTQLIFSPYPLGRQVRR